MLEKQRKHKLYSWTIRQFKAPLFQFLARVSAVDKGLFLKTHDTSGKIREQHHT